MSIWIRRDSELTGGALGAADSRSLSFAGTLACLLLFPPLSASSSEFGSLPCSDLFNVEAVRPGPLHMQAKRNLRQNTK